MLLLNFQKNNFMHQSGHFQNIVFFNMKPTWFWACIWSNEFPLVKTGSGGYDCTSSYGKGRRTWTISLWYEKHLDYFHIYIFCGFFQEIFGDSFVGFILQKLSFKTSALHYSRQNMHYALNTEKYIFFMKKLQCLILKIFFQCLIWQKCLKTQSSQSQ